MRCSFWTYKQREIERDRDRARETYKGTWAHTHRWRYFEISPVCCRIEMRITVSNNFTIKNSVRSPIRIFQLNWLVQKSKRMNKCHDKKTRCD